MTRRPILETVARAICRASGDNPDQPVYRDGNPESGVLYLRWSLFRVEAQAAISATQVKVMQNLLRKAESALATSYNATEWPADGTSSQEFAAKEIREFFAEQDAQAMKPPS